jgi:hypothetical protein
LRTRQRSSDALAACARLDAPPSLEERLRLELAGDRSRRLQRALQSLVQRPAPATLDEFVAERFLRRPASDAQRGSQKAEALRSLDVHSAPEVLERLIGEELVDPAKQTVQRFSGNLERLEAPPELEKRIGSSVRRRAWKRLLVAPVLAFAAASLVVWLTVRHGAAEPRSYRFRVVHASSSEGLDPLARALVESLGGGSPQ